MTSEKNAFFNPDGNVTTQIKKGFFPNEHRNLPSKPSRMTKKTGQP
jgi:hypothetical protein